MTGLKWRAFIRLGGVATQMQERELVREFDKLVQVFHSTNFSYDVVLLVEREQSQRASRDLITPPSSGNGNKK